MPQLQLPIFPAGTKEINQDVGVQCEQGKVVYVHGHLPVFQHEEKDLNSFRFFTSQMVVNGAVRAREVVEAFAVPMGTVKRYVGVFRKDGTAGFFQNKQRRRSETRLTPEVKEKAQAIWNAGSSVADAARQAGVLATTLHKALRTKRLQIKKKKKPQS